MGERVIALARALRHYSRVTKLHYLEWVMRIFLKAGKIRKAAIIPAARMERNWR
jgi:hypothetical protein